MQIILSLMRRRDLTKQYDISFLKHDYKTLSHDYETRETVTTVMDSNGHTCILKMLFENRTWRWESTIRLMTQAETENNHAVHISKKDLAIPLVKPSRGRCTTNHKWQVLEHSLCQGSIMDG